MSGPFIDFPYGYDLDTVLEPRIIEINHENGFAVILSHGMPNYSHFIVGETETLTGEESNGHLQSYGQSWHV